MNHPRSGFAAPPQGGDPSGRAEPGRGVRLMRLVRASRVAVGAMETDMWRLAWRFTLLAAAVAGAVLPARAAEIGRAHV